MNFETINTHFAMKLHNQKSRELQAAAQRENQAKQVRQHTRLLRQSMTIDGTGLELEPKHV